MYKVNTELFREFAFVNCRTPLKYGWKKLDDVWLIWQFPALFGVCWMIISNNLVMSFSLSRTSNKHIIYSMIIEKQYNAS